MLCTILEHKGKLELIYGRQEFTGIDNPKFYEVPEGLVSELRDCASEQVQVVISKIKSLCPEIF